MSKFITSFATSPGAIELTPGASVALTATVTYSDASTLNVTSVSTWTASGGVGWVDTLGNFQGSAAGFGTVTASYNSGSGTWVASSAVTCDQISPITLGSARTIPGQTVLVLGIVSGLQGRQYYVPYPVSSLRTITTFYGNSRLTQAVGEVLRQGAQSVMVVAIPNESQYAQLFTSLADLPFDILVVAGLLATPTRITNFANLVSAREALGVPITIVMAADPTPGVSTLTASPIGVNAGINTALVPPSPLARSFVFTLDQVMINPNVPSQYQADAAPSIAGLLGREKPKTSVTNVPLQGLELVSPYSATDSANLAAAGYLVLRQSVRRGPVPYLAVTGASNIASNQNYSPLYHRLTSIRIINYVVNTLRTALLPFIGTTTATAAIKTAGSTLQSLVTSGTILSYEYSATTMMLAGKITIDTALLIPYETRTISLRAQVSKL